MKTRTLLILLGLSSMVTPAMSADPPVSQERQAAEAAWMMRVGGVAEAREIQRRHQQWVNGDKSAAANVALAQSSYWLGIQCEDEGCTDGERLAAAETGRRAALAAFELDPLNPGGTYWQALNMSLAANVRGLVRSVWMLPKLRNLVNRTDELAPGYFYGATERFRGLVVTRTPELLVRLEGVTLDDGETCLRNSLATAPHFVETKVVWAEMKIRRGQRAEARRLLEEALAEPIQLNVDAEAWNASARRHARQMLLSMERSR